MKFNLKHLFILLTIFSYSAQAQFAGDAIRIMEDEVGFGARALAMGGAYTAVADDYTAMYWNPAGLTSLKSNAFFAEISHLQYKNNATFAGTLTEENQSFTRLRSLGFAFPIPTTRGSFVMGVGYNRIKDFDQQLSFSGFNTESNGLELPADSSSNAFFDQDVFQDERVVDEGGLNQWSVSAGMALSPNFNAGITLEAYSGSSDYIQDFFQEDIDNNYNTFPADFDTYANNRKLNTDYTGVGIKIGGMFNLNSGMKIGGTISLPKTITAEEIYNETEEWSYDNGDSETFDYETFESEYKVKLPYVFDAGVAFSNDKVTLSGSMRHRDWSQVRFEIDDELLDTDFAEILDENPIIRETYRATTELRLGGEFYLPNLNAYVRGGYAVLPTPLKDVSSDYNRQYISGGLGFVLDKFVTLNITYLRGSWKQESEGAFSVGGTLEDITKNKIIASLNYKF